MWEKEKISKPFSTGILILIFLLLFIQFVFFVLKAVDNYMPAGKDAEVTAEITAEVSAEAVVCTGEVLGDVEGFSDDLVEVKVTDPRERNEGTVSRLGDDGNLRMGKDSSSVREKGKIIVSKRQFHNYPIEINRADTSDFNSLYGIGAYYARKIVEYREELGGSFVIPEQIMEVWGIDSARFYGFSDRLFVDSSTVIYLDLYSLGMDSLAMHPYIGSYAARGIERFRRMVEREDFTVDKLVEYNIIGGDRGEVLKLYCR